MRNATRMTVSTFGMIAGLAGIEHGLGEILQGNRAPEGIFILSWPETAFFRIHAGEPAMTLVPSLLLTGILAVFFSLLFLAQATLFVRRRHTGLVLVLLSVVMLLAGAGFGPPLLGLLLGAAATRMHTPSLWWRAHLPAGVQRFLTRAWPWVYGAGLAAWLMLMPGLNFIDYFFELEGREGVVYVFVLAAFGSLLLAILTAFAHDLSRQTGEDLTSFRNHPHRQATAGS